MTLSDEVRYKWAMLGCAVGDPPWDTGMAFVDTDIYVGGRSLEELAELVRNTLLELLDDDLIFFYRADPRGARAP